MAKIIVESTPEDSCGWIFLQKLSTIDDVTKYRGMPVSRYVLRRYIIVRHLLIPRITLPITSFHRQQRSSSTCLTGFLNNFLIIGRTTAFTKAPCKLLQNYKSQPDHQKTV